MRVTTDLWVSALVRRVFSDGGFAAVIKRGATEAGAIFILCRDRMGEITLYGPAPQASYDMAFPDERFFNRLAVKPDEEAVAARLEKEKRFDSDIWVVEIEPGRLPLQELVRLILT
ncbi:DUF1491 family protein [Corticibacterium sp. UT-5YL-CI-8]|nr:DUF1491 family protein [Tianweitania sp. UT-5YL-CI-8]